MNKLQRAWKWFCYHGPLVEPAVFEKWAAEGICSNGETFQYRPERYYRANGITCDVPDYLAMGAKQDGYYRVGDVMYPLENIVSLKWRRVEQICTTIPYEQYNFKIGYSPAEMFAEVQAARKILKDEKTS